MENQDESNFWRKPRRVRRGVVVWASLGTAGVVAAGVVVATMAGGSSADGVPMADAGAPSRVADRPGSPQPETSAEATPTASPTKSRKASPPPSEKAAAKGAVARPTPKQETKTPSKTKAPRKTKAAEPKTSAPKGTGSGGPEAQVVEIVNARRAENGCGPVKSDSRLAKAAEGHSADMSAQNYFSHTGKDGRSAGDRINATGYRWSGYGENIAKGQGSAESAMSSWMNSPGHRKNILNCNFTEIGVGTVKSGGPYWTQVFGTPR